MDSKRWPPTKPQNNYLFFQAAKLKVKSLTVEWRASDKDQWMSVTCMPRSFGSKQEGGNLPGNESSVVLLSSLFNEYSSLARTQRGGLGSLDTSSSYIYEVALTCS